MGCHEGDGAARWDLPIAAADTYTIAAWWPAAPKFPGWSDAATFEVIAGREVLAAATFGQQTGGDAWHMLYLPLVLR